MNNPTTADLNKLLKYSVIPVNGKTPLISWEEYTKRLPTLQEREEWQKVYAGKEIGIVTGKVSGLFVLDIDGEDGFNTLAAAGLDIPKTWTVKTPRGYHFYFNWVNDLNNKVTTKAAILDKIDTRGEGGYCKFYGWKNKPSWMIKPANPPQWLIDLLPNKFGGEHKESETSRGTVISSESRIPPPTNDYKVKGLSAINTIKEGNRNDSLASMAGSLRSRGYNVEEIFELLKPKAKEVGVDEKELFLTCKSIGRYEPHHIEGQASSIESFLEAIEKVEWICEPIIARQTLGFVAGLPETNKTWMMIDLAVECARGGGMWLKKFPVKAAKVLFVDQERFRGETQRRFKAVMAGKNISAANLRNALFVRCGTTTRLDLQVSCDAFRKEVSEIRPDLVIIDSFVSFHTSDENNRQAIQVVLERVKQIRNEFGCTFLFIDHENKGVFHDKEKDAKEQPSAMRMAGSVAKPAAAELVLTVRRQDAEASMVYHTKSTLASTTDPFMVKVIDLDLERTRIAVEAY